MLTKGLFYLFTITSIISVIVFVANVISIHFIGDFKLYHKLRSCSIITIFFADLFALLFIFICILGTEKPILSTVIGLVIEVVCINTMYTITATRPLSMFRSEIVRRRFYRGVVLFTVEMILNEDYEFNKTTYCPVCNNIETDVSPTDFRCSRCGLHINLTEKTGNCIIDSDV